MLLTLTTSPRQTKRKKNVINQLKSTHPEGTKLVRVLLTSVTSPALEFLDTTIPIQAVVTPAEHERSTRETAMTNARKRVLGALVSDVVVRVAQLLVHNPNHGNHAKASKTAAVAQTVHVRRVEQRIIRHGKPASAAGGHFSMQNKNVAR